MDTAYWIVGVVVVWTLGMLGTFALLILLGSMALDYYFHSLNAANEFWMFLRYREAARNGGEVPGWFKANTKRKRGG